MFSGNENDMDCNKRKNMLCKKVILSSFQLICFLLAAYMVYVQLKAYLANQDLSITTNKNFQTEAQDVFPTFTICVVGKYWIFNNNTMPENHSVSVYSDILDGAYDDHMNYSKIRFDHVAIDVNEFISDYYTLSDDGIKIIRPSYGSQHGEQNSRMFLEIDHLDSRRICVSKTYFEKASLVEKDYIEFKMSRWMIF